MKLKNLSNEEFLLKLNELEACSEAINWVKEKGFDLKQAWNTCERYSWLYWLASRIGVEHKAIVNSACQNAKLVLKFVEEGEDRPLKAINKVERWCNCDESITTEILKSAASDAYASADDAANFAADAANFAADAAAAAADDAYRSYNAAYIAAYDAAYADYAYDAAYAAYAAAAAADSAAYDAAHAAAYATDSADFAASANSSSVASDYEKQTIQDQILINIRNLIEIED
jgi:hypothetical protein